MKEEVTLKNAERTEEIQAIIERMPSKFGRAVTILVGLLVAAFLLFGWIIRYPDVVTGEMVINANTVPIKLVANSSGKIQLNVKAQQRVKEGDYIAIIQNPAILQDVLAVNDLLKRFDSHRLDKQLVFPRDVSLGELNAKYFAFIDAYTGYQVRYKENLLLAQKEILNQMLTEQRKLLESSEEKLKISRENLRLMRKSHQRDSTLFRKEVLNEAQSDQSEMNFLSSRDAYQSMLNNMTNTREKIQETNNQLQQISIQQQEEHQRLYNTLLSTYTDLSDNLKMWEQKYVFKAPASGKVQYAKFWASNQFIPSGETVFTIVPDQDQVIGQMTLPAVGAGKVKVGQEVIIKLQNYPYMEYGSITGKVSAMSMMSNTIRTEKGDLETYLVNVDLPAQLTTNYGSILEFKFETKGTGEIITKDRRLIERLFDNLRYAVRK